MHGGWIMSTGYDEGGVLAMRNIIHTALHENEMTRLCSVLCCFMIATLPRLNTLRQLVHSPVR